MHNLFRPEGGCDGQISAGEWKSQVTIGQPYFIATQNIAPYANRGNCTWTPYSAVSALIAWVAKKIWTCRAWAGSRNGPGFNTGSFKPVFLK